MPDSFESLIKTERKAGYTGHRNDVLWIDLEEEGTLGTIEENYAISLQEKTVVALESRELVTLKNGARYEG